MGTLVNMSTGMTSKPEIAAVIGDRLSELLVAHPKTAQRELAGRIGIPTMVFNRAINGTSTPNADALKRIAIYFDVTTDWLLGMPGASKKRRALKRTI